MDSTFEQARLLFLEGVGHYEAGRWLEAERKFTEALALTPGRPSVLTNLGAVRIKLGRPDEALTLLQEAVTLEPDNAEALGHCGTALAEIGVPAQALQMFDRALARDSGSATIWRLRGTVLKELGLLDDAAESFREALGRGGDPELLHYYLAGLDAGQPPRKAPRSYVETLFDNYAAHFESHLVAALRYDAPPVLADRLAATGRRYHNALDLGCGTGLCARYLRPLADRLTGVDLSANMVEKARELGLYDGLQQGDIVEFLARSPDIYDLVVAADVFVYVGALDDVFAQVANVMLPGGRFSFTVEEALGEEFELRPSLRYAHSEAGLRRLADTHGFRFAALERRPVREDQRQPISGLFVWLERV
ncbi:tetratricopeptide repeat protein [Ramlibacter sp. PS3R-8]|uniref:tetratricopeptide repeat protein n=1 Tax=Ramlibacter sp. PS3R-8 TaxID=3133437 RepID=UPI003096AF61